MIRVMIIREGTRSDGTKVSDIRVRARGERFESVDIDGMPEAFEAARYALLENASDEQIVQLTSFVDQWQAGIAYKIDQLVQHAGIVYRVQQGHTSQSDWLPPNVPALFQAIG